MSETPSKVRKSQVRVRRSRQYASGTSKLMIESTLWDVRPNEKRWNQVWAVSRGLMSLSHEGQVPSLSKVGTRDSASEKVIMVRDEEIVAMLRPGDQRIFQMIYGSRRGVPEMECVLSQCSREFGVS